MKTNQLVQLSMLLLALGALTGRAQTTSIAIEDSSFEANTNSSFNTAGDSPDFGDGSNYTVGGIDDTATPYTPSTPNTVWIRNPGNSEFPPPGFDPNGNDQGDHQLPSPADGYQALMIQSNSGAKNTATYKGTSLGDFTAGDTYTLTVAIGAGIGDGSAGTYTLDLLGNGVEVATNSSSAPVSGTFADLTLTYVAASNQAIGFDLSYQGSNTSGINQVYFDNVQLTQTVAAPEPASVMLMLAGTLTLILFRVRNRRDT